MQLDTPAIAEPSPASSDASLTPEGLASGNALLGDVSAAVEKTFLGASKRTMQTVRDLRQVSRLVEEIASTGEQALDERIEQLAVDAQTLHLEDAQSAETWKSLDAVADKVDAMGGELESLERCYAMFPVLRVLTQIHGSSLMEASRDLDWFADAIAGESERGSQVVGSLLVTVKRQATKLKAAIRRAAEFEHELRAGLNESETLLKRTAEQMDALERSNAQAVRSLQTRQQAISSATTDLVSSMQFQDAFRQRVEHVQHALEQLSSLHTRQVLPGFDKDRVLNDAEVATATTVLVSIVKDQTLSLARDLEAEQTQLDQSLGQLSEQASALRHDLAVALRSRERQHADDRMQDTLRSYGVRVGMLVKVRKGRAAITDSLQSSLAEMDADLLALEQVGEAIFLLAVNAVVLAARLGTEGRAIEQIAQQVRSNSTQAGAAIRLVRELTEQLRSLCAVLTSEVAAAQGDSAPAETDDQAPTEATLREQALALMVTLDTRSEQADEVLGFCQNVHSGFLATRNDFGALSRATRNLQQASSVWGAVADGRTLDTQLHPDLVRALADYFNAHYTMESERVTQGLALMLGAVGVPEESPPAADAVVANEDDPESDDDDLSDILF